MAYPSFRLFSIGFVPGAILAVSLSYKSLRLTLSDIIWGIPAIGPRILNISGLIFWRSSAEDTGIFCHRKRRISASMFTGVI